jgi:hypothetical protein
MNKRFFIFFIFLLTVAVNGFAQVKKVYAFKQASIPGNIIATDENDIKENNGTKEIDRKQNFNYWFYLSIPKKEKITITGLWIDGKQHEIKQDSITDLPVKKIIYTGLQKNDTIIMAPATVNKIVLVYPGGIRNNDSKYALKYTRANELVIRYTWKNKTYYTSVKKIKELIPDVRV